MKPIPTSVVLPLFLSLLASECPALDTNANGLSDVWEQRFKASALQPPDDSDGDGFSNLNESIAGTDPLDSTSKPNLAAEFFLTNPDEFQLSFTTLSGKYYHIEQSENLSTFTALNPGWWGDDKDRELTLSKSGASATLSPVRAEFWKNVATGSISGLTDLPSFPLSPDGASHLPAPNAPEFVATGYGARIVLSIKAPESGSYRFYVSSGGPADLYFGSASPGAKIAGVLPAQTGLGIAEWQTHPNQKSAEIAMTAGQKYSLELRYVAAVPSQHAQIGWSGPGLSGVEPLNRDDLFIDLKPAGSEKETSFYRLAVADQDQDSDGISDWEEIALAKFHPFLFFDSETINGTADATALTVLLAQSQGKPVIALYATDAAAFESNAPNTTPDHAKITITRSGTLEPMAVKLCVAPLAATGSTATVCDGTCCMLIGSAGDEKAETGDYTLVDQDGNTITDTVNFEFGEKTKILTLTAVSDSINEYPETVNLAVDTSTAYDISTVQNSASIQLFDLPDHPDNNVVFTGTFSQDGRAVVAAEGSGYTTALINGPRTKIYFWNEFSNLTSPQQDSHVHKAGPGNAPGDIVYAITVTPGNEESDPVNGPLTEYPWDLTTSSGSIPTAGGSPSKQTIIDSLFGQNSETPLYLNIHTVNNPAGEIWAFLTRSDGSSTDPGDAAPAAAPGSAGYPQLSGEMLEVEVRRFLNQATFGATDENVAALLNKINTARLTNPSYHRHQAFSEWIDQQMNPQTTPQTFLLDFAIASHFQHLKVSGIFDPVRNPSDGSRPTPSIPTPWPSINRSNPIPEHWYLSAHYPFTHQNESLSEFNRFNFGHFGPEDVLCADWQLKLNGRDQLRHKMGFALQQIVVTSDVDLYIRENQYGSANYRDMLNNHAFDHYRDVLGFVNWSPIMGHWLSSIKNQKAIDFDKDGIFDSYPDENLARENMQLFSIGLFDIWSDGTLKLNSSGLPKPTYTNSDIQEFAKILTGQGVSHWAGTANIPTWGGVPYSPTNTNFFASHTTRGFRSRVMLYPMKMFGAYHSTGPKTFAGTTIDNTALTNTTSLGVADVESAMDWLAGKPGDNQPDFDMVRSHVSTPAFITKRLIQRFTTSNPSKDYLHRAATVFKNSEGDLGLTLKQILLDPEARNLDLNETVFGMKKSPLETYLQMVRTLGGHTYFPLVQPGPAETPYSSLAVNYANPDFYLTNFGYPAAQIAAQERNVRFRNTYTTGTGASGLQMDPAYQQTVFNFYLPEYAKGGAISDAGLVTPELQLATEPDIIRNINYFQALIYTSNGQAGKFLGEVENDQKALFGNPTGVADFDHLRLPLQALADDFYPNSATAAGGRTRESIADEALLNALDQRLTNGLLKLRYPYDATNNDDPAIDGVDDRLKNPRELIIDAITAGYSDALDGSNDASDQLNKFKDALYLLTLTSEFQIRK